MLLLIVENEIELTQNIYLHLIVRFLFIFSITIPFDIRDLKYDQRKIKTIPIVVGERKSKWIAVMSLIVAQLIIIAQMIYFNMAIHFFISYLLLFCVTSLFIINSTQKKNTLYYSFWVESMSVFCYIFLTLSTWLI